MYLGPGLEINDDTMLHAHSTATREAENNRP